MNFWLIATALSLLVALICFYPLLFQSHKNVDNKARDKLNKAFYFNRLKEIEADEQQGLLENPEQAKLELQQTLLEDIPEQAQSTSIAQKSYGKIWFVTGFISLALLASVAYFPVGSWRAEDMLEKTYQKLPHFYQRLQQEESNPLDEAEMRQFATALRLDLQKHPNNAKNWWLLGQIGMATDNGQLALDSYAKAAQLEPQNTEYKLAYARILMFSEDSTDKLKGELLLKEVIRQDHTNTQALSLLAFNFFEKENYKMAAVTWSMMLKMLPKDDPKVELIEKSIRSARDALAEQEAQKKQQLTPDEIKQKWDR